MKKAILSLSTITLTAALLLAGCSDKEKRKSLTEGGMKCGPGKCGASMVDGSAILVKKKINILNQLRKNDDRRDCVLSAKTTKALYNCVRNPKTGRLSTKCAADKSAKDIFKKSEMKCEAGKCGGK